MEETGLIVPIGEWVLHQACMKAAAWQNGSLRGRGVAVNVSAVQFARPDFVSLVARTLEKTGLRPELLELELTESLLIGDFEKSKRALAELKGMGVTVAIDDFGTGYSCLAYLQHLAIDALKIDKCFVSGIEQSKSKAAVFRGLAAIAHELSIRIIAEGVETPNQYRAVAEFGCHEAQGFLLGRPGPEISPHSPLLIRPNLTARRYDAGKNRFPLSCHTSAMEERQ
jgi:EAL domain-containing protein (putative c-di-GMP-specific phosphodiesterase class I)